jgi:hypothetical protein
VALLAAAPAGAGTLCGTLTDSDTGLPVTGAGVFARLPDGSYAGALAVSDADGAWCIDGLEAGTYTLEIRIDDYLTVYRNGIEVTSDLSDVPVSLQQPAARLDPLWPNPAAGGVNMRMRVARPTGAALEIYDLRGRLVRAWNAVSLGPGLRDYHWDGRRADGRPAPSGIYLVRLRTDDAQAVRRLVLSR